jgi:dTDP-4-amino-4,6-dideoxygalactose transaminase
MKYNPWPLGNVPEHLRRPEIAQLREAGYKFGDAREAVDIFEKKVAEFAGCKYGVAVDSCSHGLFLCLKAYRMCYEHEDDFSEDIYIPERTYISVAMQILNAGFQCHLMPVKWSGYYWLHPTNIIDAAVRWKRGMYISGSNMVVSFQIKKRIPIGRGGMILTDSKKIYSLLKLMSYDGRDLDTPYDAEDHVKCMGYHYYMTPEDAARGIMLMDAIKEEGDSACYKNYPIIQLKNFI